jgi:hypothetical protein
MGGDGIESSMRVGAEFELEKCFIILTVTGLDQAKILDARRH